MFWQNLIPGGGGQPDGDLADVIDVDFGSFDAFKSQLVQASSTIMGSGWGALGWDSIGRRLVTLQIHDHQSETAQGSVPLLVVDAWEHAYYLQYQTDKARYFEALWNLWNWPDVAERFAQAQHIDLGLRDTVQEGLARAAA
jgi:superoxide dismutase, Fe-Mn family